MRLNPAGASTAGAAAAAAAKNPAHSHDGQIGDAEWPEAATVAPSAATSTSPIKPITRSTRITVVASVFDFAARAVSRMRTTSPPILLGRKLLKKPATRNDPSKVRPDRCTRCA